MKVFLLLVLTIVAGAILYMNINYGQIKYPKLYYPAFALTYILLAFSLVYSK